MVSGTQIIFIQERDSILESLFLQNWNLVPFFGLNQRYFVLFLSANSKISHINSRNKRVNTNWNRAPCKPRKYPVFFPHTWECSFVYVELKRDTWLFPHAWECSCKIIFDSRTRRFFPTCVGVFLIMLF